MKEQLLKIVKIGGNVINDEIALSSFLKGFAAANLGGKSWNLAVHDGFVVTAVFSLEPGFSLR